MRNKSPLALMEQLIMVLVFALAAAICLRVFMFADLMSERNAAIDRAVTECQNAAEVLKSAGGDMAHAQQVVTEKIGGNITQGLLSIWYDENWNILSEEHSGDCAYVLEIHGVPTDIDKMWKAQIQMTAGSVHGVDDSGESLFQIEAAWQEVSSNG